MADVLLFIKDVDLDENQYMTDLYPDGMPSDTVIKKTLTGIRATTCELEAPHDSIIIVPNVPVIEGKQEKYSKILGVKQGVNSFDIAHYLLNDGVEFKKILTTPESYGKVKEAFQRTGIDMYQDYTLMIDECEKAVQEADFRPDIIEPYFDLFNFKSKFLISATPLFPNLKGFENNLFYGINIKPTFSYQKDLSLIATNNVPEEFSRQIAMNSTNKKAIFLNSPTYAKMLIDRHEIKHCSKVYTSADGIKDLKKEGYMTTDRFQLNETLQQYSFFTSRFYSAVDLETEDKPDIIMVTDCLSKRQTMIDPYTHAIQITGRFRFGMGSITHITNYNNKIAVKSREDMLQQIKEQKGLYDAIKVLKEAETGGGRALLKEIEDRTPFARFIFKEGRFKGKTNPFLIECFLEKEKVKGFYKHPLHLKDAYVNTKYFNVTYHYEKYAVSSGIIGVTSKRLSKKRKIEIVERLKVLKPSGLKLIILTNEQELELSNLWEEASTLCHFYELHGADKIVELDYDLTAIKRELKTYNKKQLYIVPLKDIYNYFELGTAYPENKIQDVLQSIYNKYHLVDDDGKPLRAKGTYLNKYFKASDRKSIPHSREKGYTPLERKFLLED